MKRLRFMALIMAVCLIFPMTALALEASDDLSDSAWDSGEAQSLFEVYQVSLPSNWDFVIDPFEISGRGQIYSSPLAVSNQGDTAVLITILNARCIVKDSGVHFSQEPIDPFTQSEQKDVQIFLRRADGNRKLVIPLSQEPADPVRFVVESGEEAIFEVGGTVNPNPKNPWMAGDIKIAASIGIEPVRTRRIPLEEE